AGAACSSVGISAGNSAVFCQQLRTVLGSGPLSLSSIVPVSGVLYLGEDLWGAATHPDLDSGELCPHNARGTACFRNGRGRRRRGLDLFRLFLQNRGQELRH